MLQEIGRQARDRHTADFTCMTFEQRCFLLGFCDWDFKTIHLAWLKWYRARRNLALDWWITTGRNEVCVHVCVWEGDRHACIHFRSHSLETCWAIWNHIYSSSAVPNLSGLVAQQGGEGIVPCEWQAPFVSDGHVPTTHTNRHSHTNASGHCSCKGSFVWESKWELLMQGELCTHTCASLLLAQPKQAMAW